MKTEMLRLLDEVKANLAKKESCPRHRFDPLRSVSGRVGAKLTCRECGAEVRTHDIREYAAGYKAAGGDPDDICEGII